MSNSITWGDFEKVKIAGGRITRAESFPEARKPAYKLWIDFGDKLGMKQSSAQVTDNYTPQELVGMDIVAIVNFPPKQIGPFMSEVLVLGTIQPDGKIVLLSPNKGSVPGAKVA